MKNRTELEVHVVTATNNLAYNFTKHPVGELHVKCHSGKGAHEDEGRCHQVQQLDVGHSGQLLKPAKKLLVAATDSWVKQF